MFALQLERKLQKLRIVADDSWEPHENSFLLWEWLLLMMLIEIAGFIFHHHYKDVLESFHRHHQGSSRAREPPSSNYYVYVMLSEFPSEMGEAKEGEFILGDPPHTPFTLWDDQYIMHEKWA